MRTAEVYLEILEIQPVKVDLQNLKKVISWKYLDSLSLYSSLRVHSKVDEIKLATTKTVSGLDLKDARGQSYDGCRAMAGREKGVAARIRKKFPKMPFIHCH